MQKVRRIVALLSVIVMVVLIIAALICAVIGSEYFLGIMFLALAVPIVLWVFMWFARLVNEDEENGAD